MGCGAVVWGVVSIVVVRRRRCRNRGCRLLPFGVMSCHRSVGRCRLLVLRWSQSLYLLLSMRNFRGAGLIRPMLIRVSVRVARRCIVQRNLCTIRCFRSVVFAMVGDCLVSLVVLGGCFAC